MGIFLKKQVLVPNAVIGCYHGRHDSVCDECDTVWVESDGFGVGCDSPPFVSFFFLFF